MKQKANKREITHYVALIQRISAYLFFVLLFGIMIQVMGIYQNFSFRNRKMILLFLRINSSFYLLFGIYALIFTAINRHSVMRKKARVFFRYLFYILFGIISTAIIIVWDIFMLPDR